MHRSSSNVTADFYIPQQTRDTPRTASCINYNTGRLWYWHVLPAGWKSDWANTAGLLRHILGSEHTINLNLKENITYYYRNQLLKCVASLVGYRSRCSSTLSLIFTWRSCMHAYMWIGWIEDTYCYFKEEPPRHGIAVSCLPQEGGILCHFLSPIVHLENEAGINKEIPSVLWECPTAGLKLHWGEGKEFSVKAILSDSLSSFLVRLSPWDNCSLSDTWMKLLAYWSKACHQNR